MAKTKATVKRLPIKTLRRPAWMVSKEYGTRKRTIYPFKEKEPLPKQRPVNITKNGQVIKTTIVRRKSKYFTGKNRLIF